MTSETLKNKLTSTPFDFVLVHQSLITDMALLPRNHFVILAPEPDKSALVSALNHEACGYFLEDPFEDLLRATLHLPQGGCLLDAALTLWALEHISDQIPAAVNIEVILSHQTTSVSLHQAHADTEPRDHQSG